jgi:hypothetical protein
MGKPRTALAGLSLLIGFGLGLPAPTTDYTALDNRAAPLRTTFNADIGKVRVLMLVAPT